MKTSCCDRMLVTYAAIFRKSEKTYIVPGMESIQGLLKRIHGIDVEVRRLYYARKDLVNEKLIRTQERYDNKPDGTVYQQSPMVFVTLKGAFRLYAMGFTGALAIIKRIKSFLNKTDQRFPKSRDIKEEFTEIDCDRNLTEVKKLLDSIS